MPATDALIGGTAHAAHQRKLGLHPGEQQKQQNAELREAVEHRLLLGDFRKQEVLRLGPERAEHGGTEQETRDQLPHHGRLADPQHALAKQPADHDQKDDLADQHAFGGAGLALRAPGGRSDQKRREKPNRNRGRETLRSRHCRPMLAKAPHPEVPNRPARKKFPIRAEVR